ncbi:MAG: UDP-N-acetylmuramoyl-L-alanine--D-glutamate ligase [Calditrichia bacterium]
MMTVNEQILYLKKNLNGTRISVIGAAKSGISAAKLAVKHGAKVFVSEKYKMDEAVRQQLSNHHILYEDGGHSERVLNSDLIILSPGVPQNIPILLKAKEKHIPIISEIEFGFWFEKGFVIAITGSQGKTTTTTLIGQLMDAGSKKFFMGGNIGIPYCDFVEQTKPDTISVLEVSSFQLETIYQFRPEIIVITNLTPNHLDRYKDFEDYVQAKMQIFKNISSETAIVYNLDDPVSNDVLKSFLSIGRGYPFTLQANKRAAAFVEGEEIKLNIGGEITSVMKKNQTKLKGNHNLYNIVASATVARLVKIDFSSMIDVFSHFEGIEHRLEFVKDLNGVLFYNDSKATTVSSLRYALESFANPIILIAGGKDKGGSFVSIQPLVSSKVKKAILIGESRQRIFNEWKGATEMEFADSLEEAVKKAYKAASENDVVLLSPACSSFDMFKNYEERGNRYKYLVNQLK